MELSALLASGGMKSVQTGWVETTTPTIAVASSDEDAKALTVEDQVYVDIAISAVDISKAVAMASGGFGYYGSAGPVTSFVSAYFKPRLSTIYVGSSSYAASSLITARLINATTLRLSSDRPVVGDGNITAARLSCRWTVVEGK